MKENLKNSKRQKYKVLARQIILQDSVFPEFDENIGEWEKVGETVAISEKQAINNIKYRIYNTDEFESKWIWLYEPQLCNLEIIVEWKAEEITK